MAVRAQDAFVYWRAWSNSRRLCEQTLSVARTDVRKRQQDQQIGDVEVGIPGRLPANPCADVEIAFHQRRQLGLPRGIQALERQPASRKRSVFKRTKVPVLAVAARNTPFARCRPRRNMRAARVR